MEDMVCFFFLQLYFFVSIEKGLFFRQTALCLLFVEGLPSY
jgi:hypothetical protein